MSQCFRLLPSLSDRRYFFRQQGGRGSAEISFSLLGPEELPRGEENKHLRMEAKQDKLFLCVGAWVHFS